MLNLRGEVEIEIGDRRFTARITMGVMGEVAAAHVCADIAETIGKIGGICTFPIVEYAAFQRLLGMAVRAKHPDFDPALLDELTPAELIPIGRDLLLALEAALPQRSKGDAPADGEGAPGEPADPPGPAGTPS